MKQETLEEAAERLLRSNINEVNSFIRIGAFKFGVKLGVKWQAERMYSEEEVLELLKKFALHIRYNYKELPHTWSQVVKEWFEQFKKK